MDFPLKFKLNKQNLSLKYSNLECDPSDEVMSPLFRGFLVVCFYTNVYNYSLVYLTL